MVKGHRIPIKHHAIRTRQIPASPNIRRRYENKREGGNIIKSKGTFTYGKHIIHYKKYNEPIFLIPFGDIHRSAPLCHVEKWKEWLESAKNMENAYFIGMGDYDDMASESERGILTNQSLHESTIETLDNVYRDNVRRLVDEISFMKGKLLGLIEGNHYSELSSGITTTQLMCELLDCKYLGVSSFIRLALRHQSRSQCLDIWAHHGLSGGRTAGASIMKLENMTKAAEADIYLMGHDHKKHIAMQSRLELGESNGRMVLKNKKIVMARTGGFLMGYVDGKDSYIAQKAYSPVDIGTVTIKITPRRDKVDGKDTKWIKLNASL